MKNRLLIFANDAASANVTLAYASLHKNLYSSILAYPSSVAKNLYNEFIKEYIPKSSSYTFLSTDTVVLGTSGLESHYEMNILIQAKKTNVHNIIVIVDNISNFNMRFSIYNKIIEEQYIPNEIWIFEKGYQSNINYLNKRIVYKDNIYAKFIQHQYKNNPPKIMNKFIKKYQTKYIVILTEYIYELYHLRFGFTEYDMLENILKVIESLNMNTPIMLKLHPREHKNKFNIILRKYSHLSIFLVESNIQELIYYSKIVFGINSSVFQECNLFQKPTYSIQIGSKESINPTYLNKKTSIYSDRELSSILNDKII